MQGSAPRTRKTPPASAARNLAGIVSRFFASSECSKVPWKAKAHVSNWGRRVQSIRGGGVGGAPPPRTGFARGTYPTLSQSATHFSSDLPQNLSHVRKRTRKGVVCRRIAVGQRRVDNPVLCARRVADRHAPCRIASINPGAYDLWGRVGGRAAPTTKGFRRHAPPPHPAARAARRLRRRGMWQQRLERRR